MSNLFLFDMEAPPEESAPTGPPDADQRAAALDVRQSWIVEAPAGSGKTGLLIQRFLKLLADPGVSEPEQVMAITFTNKATAELLERVLIQLGATATGAPITNDFDAQTRKLANAAQARGWDLLNQPQRLRIRTIDSVCAEIARSLPVLSGSGGQLTPIPDAAPLYREAAHRTLMQLGGPETVLNQALRTLLLHRDGNLADCERLLAEMLQWRDQWGELIPLAGEALTDEALSRTVLPRIERALDRAICASLTQLAQSIPADIVDTLADLAGEMGHSEGYKGAPSPIALCRSLHNAPGETAEHLAHWRALIHLLTTAGNTWRASASRNHLGFEIEKPHALRLRELIQQIAHRDDLLAAFDRVKTLPPATYPPEQWMVTRALFRILRQALLELQLVFTAHGECDFTELGLLARTALGRDAHGEDLAAALGMRLQHLLVDEMQDTSTSQYELIERLTHGWDGHSQTVFLVGDPKQSIYLFRQARVERFVRTMRSGLLGDLPVRPLRLTANFRSQRTLVEQVNKDFALLFPSAATSDHPEDVPFAAADPTRAATDAEARRWHIHALPPGLSLSDVAAAHQQQARENAARIRSIAAAWRARPLPPGRTKPWSIAVLVRSRIHLTDIVAALKQLDATGQTMPFRAVDIDPLADRQEVLDILALTRALLHPADRVAWLAILRAPWCGLTLSDLHTLAAGDDRTYAETSITDLLSERGELLTPDGASRLERLWLVMHAAAAQRARLPTAQWVERTWRSLGGDTWLDPEATANVLRYLQLLDELEAESGSINLVLLENRLKKLYAEAANTPGAIDLMTIHGAKGLEWDVVIVPALERRGQSSRGRLLAWLELDSSDEDAASIIPAPIASRGGDSGELNVWIRSIDTARDAAERKRLVYVAATRAREELHLFAIPSTNRDGSLTAAADSLLKAAWAAAEPHFATALPSSNLIQMPFAIEREGEPLALAASGDHATEREEDPALRKPPLLHRLPSVADISARFAQHKPLQTVHDQPFSQPASQQTFHRPEGSFTARAFGNAVHAFVELLALRITAGETAAGLQAALPQWATRTAAVLRSEGLPPATVERLTRRVQLALTNILSDPIGRWLLAGHPDAASERALTAWDAEKRTTIRFDRIFRAGPDPLTTGTSHLWIVDFKTTTHGREGLDAFLLRERETYIPQMTTYTRILEATEAPGIPIRTMLYYPMIPANIFWIAELS